MTRVRLLGWTVLAAGSAGASFTGPAAFTHPDGILLTPPPVVTARPFAVAISVRDIALVGHQDVPYLQRTALPDISFGDSVRVGLDPSDIAFNGSGTLAYVTNQFSGSVSVIDVADRVSVEDIPVPGAPFRILVLPSDVAVFVPSNDDRVYAIAASSRASIDVHRLDTVIFVSSNDGGVYAIATSSKTVLHRWAFNAVINGLALTPDGGTLYASSIGGRLYKVAMHGMGAIESVEVGGKPQDVALSPDGAELYLANEAGSLEIRNPATLTLIDTVPDAAGAFGLKPTPDGVQLYATYPGSGVIRIVDRATRTVARTLTVGGTPRRIAFGQHGAVALIPNESGFVTVVR